jgi:hypothetical protein
LAKQENIPVELSNIALVQSVASVTLQAQVNGIKVKTSRPLGGGFFR